LLKFGEQRLVSAAQKIEFAFSFFDTNAEGLKLLFHVAATATAEPPRDDNDDECNPNFHGPTLRSKIVR
jgi:hypothetical protein